ncbi:hypothetical protein MVEN_00334200 [Mycena venus]|uniref:Uncharacterized protein n=1 Tax=Mycena venus TaxID=2733690 RepID=A0A8H7DA99_9AGAR|nr:hypothetical protein MVEN_00334200 [Mycena venus]
MDAFALFRTCAAFSRNSCSTLRSSAFGVPARTSILQNRNFDLVFRVFSWALLFRYVCHSSKCLRCQKLLFFHMPPLKNNTLVSLPPTFASRLSHRGWIKVFHPQATIDTGVYPMLRFAAFPNPATPEDDTDSGVPVGAVLDACSILAQNQRGRLVLADHTFIADDSSNPDLLLRPDIYIFDVMDEDGPTVVDGYPICAGFGDWILPPIIPDR